MTSQPRLLGGRYEVGERIGRGGMADVHLGHDVRLGRTVALKMLRTDLARDSSFLSRFRREAQSAASLNHPAIVAVYDSGEEHVTEAGGAVVSVPYIIMEYVDGKTLREFLNDDGPFDPDEAARITAGVLSALEYSHLRGIVHRDIKPANVMLTAGGAVKVMDFGIARALADTAATMTQSQAVMGTARYLSPEQAQGQDVDERSDIYSTGCLFYELLTGRTPFTGDPVSLVYQHIGEPARPPSAYRSGITPEFDAVVLHSLTKDRAQRYQNAAVFRHDVQAARAGGPVSDAAWATLAAAGVPAGAQALSAHDAAPEPEPALIPVDDETADMPVEEERHRGGMIVLAVLGVLAVAAIAFAAFQLFGSDDGGGAVEPPPSSASITAEPAQVSVPVLTNLTEQAAVDALEQRNLVPEIDRVASDTTEGTVFEQDPEANTVMTEGETVTITVSSGPDSVAVPDVARMDVETATGRIEEAGLSVAEDATEEFSATIAPGLVIRTDPEAEQVVPLEDEVTLVVSSADTEVPNVRGETLSDAIELLADRDIAWRVEYEDSAETDPDIVLEQSLSPGETVERGSEILLTVAREPAPTPTPTPTPEPTPTTTDEPTEEPTEDPTEDPTDDQTTSPPDDITDTLDPPETEDD